MHSVKHVVSCCIFPEQIACQGKSYPLAMAYEDFDWEVPETGCLNEYVYI